MTDAERQARARRLIACLDLTNLDEDCTEADVAALCDRAATPEGPTAAICIWPRFVAFARDRLDPAIRIATVVNFPAGGEDVDATVAETRVAVADGAEEIDLVIAYRRIPADPHFVETQVRQVKAACLTARLKTILETGEIGDPEAIRMACQAALDGGADFLKTSTGKVAESATPVSARLLLGAIADSGREVGFKPAGGIRRFEDANTYFELAEAICGPGWTTPERFRIGASSVLTDLLAVASGKARAGETAGY
ncbi:deoxyribose-phosphate aldolase [Aurantimonas sp. A2-1-M11]|uniref:deoxyribose-phosphate aldolase n=1 Tax=Aurantimonas sp. A2-1-M11 TaxID=3113712 RepID=UPI002F937C9F